MQLVTVIGARGRTSALRSRRGPAAGGGSHALSWQPRLYLTVRSHSKPPADEPETGGPPAAGRRGADIIGGEKVGNHDESE
jgi:hypothetical protein